MSHGGPFRFDYMAPAVASRWQRRALIVGMVFAIPSIIGWILDYDQFYRSYLLGYMWCFELTIGSLALLMLYHLTGGAWGTVIRRILEAAMENIWLMLLLFVPIIIGVHRLYPWSRPEELAANAHLRELGKVYLNLGWWLVRAGLYFGVFIWFMWKLLNISRQQDHAPEVPRDYELRTISGAGAVIYVFATLFLYTDWLMSLTPDWYSMIYGLIFNAGQGLAAISFAVLIGGFLAEYEPMRSVFKADQFQDNGKIMLTFVMVWGWWTYAQWIIYWSGNKPDEISWYIARTRGGWEHYWFALLMVHFCVPFALLLSRSFKTNFRTLRWLALWCLLARYMHNFFFIAPAFPEHVGHFHYSWLDAVIPISLAGFWLALFFRHLKSRPLFALQDPHATLILEQAYESGD
jgi:hypothetical protein